VSGDATRADWPALGAVAALGVLPWTVVVYAGGVDLLFPWGLVNSNPWHLTDLPAYLTVYTRGFRSLPPRLQAWPLATGLYLLAVGGGVLSVSRPEWGDARVTAGLLALAGAVHLQATLGLARIGERSLPVGAVLAFGVAWWVYARGRHGRAGTDTE
jgi:uncharacterized protein (TIGR04206 family)